MPRSTYKYPFEAQVKIWASSFAERETGNGFNGFLIVFDENFVRTRLLWNLRARDANSGHETYQETPWISHEATEVYRGETVDRYIFYDPFEGPEYTYLCWKGLTQQALERIIGSSFDWERFDKPFPEEWGVMF